MLKFPIICLCASHLLLVAADANAAFTTVGLFNPNDRFLLSSDTVGAAASDAAITSAVGSAFNTNLGGVINFESSQGTVGPTTPGQVVGNYGGGKSLTMMDVTTAAIQTSDSFFATGTSSLAFAPATSGDQWLANKSQLDISLTLSDATAQIDRIAFVLNRSTTVNGFDGRMIVQTLFSDGSMTASPQVDFSIEGTTASGFLFDSVAPSDKSITGISFRPTADNVFFYIDDFAFITSAVAVPEPSGLAFMGLLAVGTFTCRRQSKAVRSAKSAA